MKRIIEIPDRTYNFIMGLNQHTFGSKYAHKDIQADIVKAVKESKPYDDSGDLISREALKKDFKERNIWSTEIVSAINNIPTVETKQDELLDYIKLSLKQSDEFKKKYRNKYKESNSQHDLYCSHLFEGMAEAYDDLLKKEEVMKKGKQDRLRGSAE